MGTDQRVIKDVTLTNLRQQQIGLFFDTHAHPAFGSIIFISKIQPGSIFGRPDKLLVGDQILKINGKVVNAVKLIEDELKKKPEQITFSISRLNKDRENTKRGVLRNLSPVMESDGLGENSGVEKDSGISRTTDSDQSGKSLTIPEKKGLMTINNMNSHLEYELAALRQEMENIRLECDRLLNKQETVVEKPANLLPWRNQNLPPIHGLRRCQVSLNLNPPLERPHSSQRIKILPRNGSQSIGTSIKINEETSSAYNSGGDSCRSTPLIGNCQGQQLRIPKNPVSTENAFASFRVPVSSVTPAPDPVPNGSYRLGDTYYTSREKLAETLAFQQNAVREIMRCCQTDRKEDTVKDQQKSEAESQEYTWKLKRRSDGSCYITKKPVRHQVLKAREEQLNKERTGLSTDDDAASELKNGRFWSREERKKQLEKAREKKADKIQKQKKVINRDQMIIQLSNRKQMKRSGRQLFDNFTTIQEFLAHGSRDPTAAPIGGILSVTTV